MRENTNTYFSESFLHFPGDDIFPVSLRLKTVPVYLCHISVCISLLMDT